MLKNYRPLLLPNLGISLGGLTVRQVRLNHHTPEPVWSSHAHDHGQILIYLSGRGRQKVGERFFDCRPGAVVFVPPQTAHEYERSQSRAPLIMVLDIDLDQSRATAHVCARLPDADLAGVKDALASLFSLKAIEHRESVLAVGSVVLAILDRALRVAGWLRPVNRFGDSRNLAITQFMERLIERSDGPEVTLADLAQRAGYQVDVLNRKLKGECGMTLGQLRSKQRLKRAQQMILQGLPIQTVGERVNIPDNNYFTRWFRQQTGLTPTKWKAEPRRIERF